MSLTWFRLYGETVDDAKLKLLAFEDRWHYIALLCCKAQGVTDNTRPEILDRMVAAKLGLALRELDEVRRRLIEVELIDQEWQPTGWDRRQYASDDVSARVRRFRERAKTPPQTPPEEETETDTERGVTGNDSVTLHETLPKQEWGEWIAHRKQRRFSCTPLTLRKQLSLLARYDTKTQREMLDTAIQAGWRGLFPPKNQVAFAHPPKKDPYANCAN